MNTIDSWSSIETIIKQRLDFYETDRRYCVVCNRQGPSLSRCFACQMVYYCGEEHQAEDWSKIHVHKCAELEWVALGEFIQALPAQPPLPELGDKWDLSLNEINHWKNWFSIRPNIVQLANNTANILQNLAHVSDKRQPTYENAVDGLLAAVTDLLTHVLTIGKAIIKFGLQPNISSLVIHIHSGFNKIDLIGNDQSSITSSLPARFHELLNMFPDNNGVELVIVIGDDDQNDTDHLSLPHAKLKPDRLIITTTGKGHRLDKIEDERLQPTRADLLVYFDAASLFLSSNKEQLKLMLTRQRPTLLTFDDQDDFNHAKAYLSTKNIPIHQAGTNQFSSMILRQRSNRPNSTYSTNSYQILLNAMTINESAERNVENYSLLSRQHCHQSSVGIQQQQLNPGLKQVNGKMHIESLSSSSSTSSSSSLSHNTRANNNGTLLDTNVRIVSTTNTTTTVQSLARSNHNNNIVHQPAIVQRRHHSQPASTQDSTTQPINTAAMITAIEHTRNNIRPQPKPRSSLVRTVTKEAEPSQVNGSIVQRIKPFFEQTSSQPPSKIAQETKPFQQQRQPVSIPQTDDTKRISKATCLDDLISSNRQQIKSPSPPPIPPSPPIETYSNGRTAAVPAPVRHIPISSSSIDKRPSPPVATALQNSRSIIERYTNDERTIKSPMNSVSSPLTTQIEFHHDQRSGITTNTTTPRPSSSSSSSSYIIEKRFDERTIPITKPTSPPPRPPSPPTTTTTTTTTSNEIIYTEVMKNPSKQSLPLHRIDLTKTPISPSRSFIIPTKSPSISSSKNPSFNYQRPSRSATTTNFSYQISKPKPIPSMMSADRISLYSQRSAKQADAGVAIENLSECIDRVGVVFDESNRPNNTPSTGLTTADLIREQLSVSSNSKSTGSLLDKLYKSNSSTRLQTSTTRRPINLAAPRSKSQQAPRTPVEQPTMPKPSSTTTQPVRRNVGVFLPLTPKATHEPEQTSALVYQNIEPHITSATTTTTTRMPDYTLKQHIGPVCNGVPKPFRKPTAIIEPSPVVPTPVSKDPEPNYINLTHQDEHIYTNENGFALQNNSNSNSYTSKTSSIYSSSDKQSPSSHPQEVVYAVAHAPTSSQHEQSIDYDSFDDELAVDNIPKNEIAYQNHDNTDDDSFDDDEQQQSHPHHQHQQQQHASAPSTPSKMSSANFLRSTINRLTRSNKSLDRLNTEMPTSNDFNQELNLPITNDPKAEKKTLRSIKARREAKKTGNMFLNYANDDDTTSIDSNCSTQTATSLNKSSKSSSHQRFRLFRRKIEKEFASDTEAEKHQTEQRRKKFNKKLLNQTAHELKTKRLLMMSDDDDEDIHVKPSHHDETHIYDRIIHDETSMNTNSSRMGKLSHETHLKSPTITLDEIRSELQAEIAARQDHHPMINQTNNSSNFTLQKKRSKSVTFLDELLSDDTKPKPTNLNTRNDMPVKPSTTAKRIEKGDARSICGALTGTGPIRGIIKAANNDITGTTAPISPSAAATIYLSGTTMDTRCTSPKVAERTTQRPLSTYTVGSARFYDGAAISTIPTVQPPPPPPPPSSQSQSQPSSSFNQSTNSSNHRPILTNSSSHSSTENPHHKRPTAKVSPFQTKSPNDLSSPPKQQATLSSTTTSSKKPLRSSINRNIQMSHDITNFATPSLSDGVGGVSKRLQSNF